MTQTGRAGGWRAVARLDDLEDPGLLDVEAGRQLVLLVRQGDRVRAYQGLCPHQFARLSGGTLDGERLQCPRHLAQFRLADGVCPSGWDLPALKRYAVRVADGVVLLAEPLAPL